MWEVTSVTAGHQRFVHPADSEAEGTYQAAEQITLTVSLVAQQTAK
jgi:hypothetical protein